MLRENKLRIEIIEIYNGNILKYMCFKMKSDVQNKDNGKCKMLTKDCAIVHSLMNMCSVLSNLLSIFKLLKKQYFISVL